MYHASQVKIDAKENLKVNCYHEVSKAKMNELKSLQELHDKNWLEFKEIIKVGHSELEQNGKMNRDILKVNELCKTCVTNKLKLPLAFYISQGQWLVATNKPFYLRKLCVKSTLEERITVSPPLIVVSLDYGCRALADKLELPIYFEERSEYKVERETRITTPIRRNLTNLPIWTLLVKHHVDVNFDSEKLSPIDSKPIDEFIQMLEETKNKGKFKFYPSSAPYIAIALVVFILLMVVVIVCMKRQFIMGLLTKTVLKNISSSKEVPHRKHSVASSDSDKESDQVHQTVSGTAQTAQGARRKVIKTVASSAKSNVMYNGKDPLQYHKH